MDQKIISELKTELEKEKKHLIDELESFASENKNIKGDWQTKYENLGSEWDDNAQEVTQYITRLPLEHTLETRLQDINDALSKTENGTYGLCEIGDELITVERLKADPAARTCAEHAR